jgi:hypothetical protein
LVVPVPGGASGVRGLGVVGFREEALAVAQVVTLEARSAVSIISVSLALVGNGDTDAVRVEDPAVGAGKTFLVVPVPGSTSQVRRLGIIRVREDAFSFLEVISGVA